MGTSLSTSVVFSQFTGYHRRHKTNQTTYMCLLTSAHVIHIYQGSIVQGIVSLTRLLMTNLLTVVNCCSLGIFKYIDNIAAKMWVAFAMQKLLTFFQQKLSMYLPYFRIKNFNITLANKKTLLSFEQLSLQLQLRQFQQNKDIFTNFSIETYVVGNH